MSRNHFRTQRGDTIIEVVMAFTILTIVLTSTYATANGAYQLGLSARERTALVSAAQTQAEALQSFRDAHSWTEFIAGTGGASGFPGIDTRSGSADCNPSTPPLDQCFTMKRATIGGLDQWVPQTGAVIPGGIAPGAKIYITTDSAPGNTYDFVINYEAPKAGRNGTDEGSKNIGRLNYKLINMDSLK